MASLNENFAVLGLSRFGFQVATGLFDAGVDVIAVDRDPDLVQKIADRVTRAARAEALDERVLEHLGVLDVDMVVIGFRSSFDSAVLLTMMLRKKREDIHIVVQVDTDEKAEVLLQVGANVTVFPERDIADRIVKRLTMPDLVEHIELAPDVAVIELVVPAEFVGKSLAELDIRAKHQVHVVGVVRTHDSGTGEKVLIAPPADTRFGDGDVALLLGTSENLERLSARYGS